MAKASIAVNSSNDSDGGASAALYCDFKIIFTAPKFLRYLPHVESGFIDEDDQLIVHSLLGDYFNKSFLIVLYFFSFSQFCEV